MRAQQIAQERKFREVEQSRTIQEGSRAQLEGECTRLGLGFDGESDDSLREKLRQHGRTSNRRA